MAEKKIKVYIAGPMSRLPNFNYPAFFAGEQILRKLGFEPQNPARNPEQKNWQDYMRQAVTLLVQCQCVYMLPGWSGSNGALIEHNLAQSIHIPIVYPEQWCPELPNPWKK